MRPVRPATALAAAAAAVAALTMGGARAQSPERFTLDIPLIEGGVLDASQMRGKLLVVDVWGTWCGPCRQVIPHLVEIQRRFREHGVMVIGISAEVASDYDTALRRIKEFALELGMNYKLGIINPELYDEIRRLMRFEGDTFTVPSTFVVDRDGTVIARYPGYFFGQEKEIAELLSQRLRREVERAGPGRRPEEKAAATTVSADGP